jgi:hypothetical protein
MKSLVLLLMACGIIGLGSCSKCATCPKYTFDRAQADTTNPGGIVNGQRLYPDKCHCTQEYCGSSLLDVYKDGSTDCTNWH